MTSSPLTVSRGTAAAVMLLVFVAGIGGTWMVMHSRIDAPAQAPSVAGQVAAAPAITPPGVQPAFSGGAPLADVVVPLTKEEIERAGIVVAAVATEPLADELRLPGTVEPNAYRQVSVTPLVAGRVVRVSAQLGDRVRRGQSIAQVYSPELAEARTKYVTAQSMLDAHDRELQRTQKLVEIGAASRQELERIHAEHAAQLAEVESARSRLQLLGASSDAAGAGPEGTATIDVPAPIDGVVTERLGNVGVNVDPAAKLFTIVDLSSVWVIASVYERDLHRVREGARAVIAARAFPERSFDGRVGYIDPQLSEETRTAKVRVEVANPRGELRLGMYADVAIAGGGGSAVPAIPKSAVQNVGSQQVVYLAASDDPTRFTEREVRVGRAVGDRLEISSGLKPGDSVVSQGSFYLRAEAERLGLRSAVQTARVVVNESGFEPARLRLRAGAPARITFVRTTDKTCATEVVFPSLDIKRALPLNEPVNVEFTPRQAGEIAFACGMNMLKGTVVVE
jgi:cobalt-zinc-cadmium efflux system membrane fusion protein